MHLCVGQIQKVRAVEFDYARRAGIFSGQAQNGSGKHRFAGTRFADKGEHFAASDFKINAVEHFGVAEGGTKAANRKQCLFRIPVRFCHRCLRLI